MWAINVNLKSEAPKADNIVVDIVVVVVVFLVVVEQFLTIFISRFWFNGLGAQ